MKRRSFINGAMALGVMTRLPKAWAAPSRFLLYLGTRSTDKGQGIHTCFFNAKTGTCSELTLAAEMPVPTAFALGRGGRHLYSTSELGNDGKSEGGLFAYAIDKHTGKLQLLNNVSSGGGGPTYVSIDATGKTIAVANFGSGRTTAFRILPDGKLGDKTASMQHTGTGPHRRQTAPHAHSAVFSPDNRFVLAPDLGADKVFIFRFDAATGSLTPNDTPYFQTPPGSGPRQISFHPSGKFAFLMNELSAKVTVLAWSAQDGKLTEVQTLAATSPDAKGEPSGGAIAMHPSGKFWFTTTRNDNSLESWAIDQDKGTLTLAQRIASPGNLPWGCALDPAGRHFFVTNLTSNSLSILNVDQSNGNLSSAGPEVSSPMPVTVITVPV